MKRVRHFALILLGLLAFPVQAATTLQIPEKFRGRWEPSLQDCGKPDDHEDVFLIEKGGFQFYETFETLKSIAPHSSNEVSLVLTGVYGLDEWTTRVRLKLSPDGTQLNLVGKPERYFRCPS